MVQISREQSSWCRRFNPNDTAKARLLCLPHAGGSAPFFRPVAMALGDRFDVICVQYPGRQERRAEPLVNELTELADLLHEVVSGLPPLPTVIFGHSMGAALGFELCRRMDAAGNSAARLVASGRRGPATYRDERVHQGGDQAIIADIRGMDGTAGLLLGDEEFMRMALPILRADYMAIEQYISEPDVTISPAITAMTGDDDPKNTVDEVREWEKHTTGEFDIKIFPGGHFFIADHAAAVNSLLGEHLTAAAK